MPPASCVHLGARWSPLPANLGLLSHRPWALLELRRAADRLSGMRWGPAGPPLAGSHVQPLAGRETIEPSASQSCTPGPPGRDRGHRSPPATSLGVSPAQSLPCTLEAGRVNHHTAFAPSRETRMPVPLGPCPLRTAPPPVALRWPGSASPLTRHPAPPCCPHPTVSRQGSAGEKTPPAPRSRLSRSLRNTRACSSLPRWLSLLSVLCVSS